MPAPEIALDRVSRRHVTGRTTRWLLNELTLRIKSGERVVVVGPNGSGKSTVLRMILGFERPDRGMISVHPGRDATHISYVPQDYRNALFPWLRLSGNVALWLNDRNARWPDAIEVLAARLKISFDAQKYPYQMSGGEQQLFVVAQALLRQPALLVVDEPFSAVDSGRKLVALELLTEYLHDSGCTFVGVTHDFEDAVFLADRVIVLAAESDNIRRVVHVDCPWPRTVALRVSSEFVDAVEQVTQAVL